MGQFKVDGLKHSYYRLLTGSMVNIYVGPTKRQWTLHRNLLQHHTKFFEQRVMNPSEKEDNVELLEDDPSAFEMLVKYLYQGKIDDVAELASEKKWAHAESCQKLYFLCDRIGLHQLKNCAIDQFRRACFDSGLVPGPEEMRPVYDNTSVGSPFRTLISQIAARQIMDPESDNSAATYQTCFENGPEFAVDVINAIRDGAGGKLLKDPTQEVGCFFHEHQDDELCQKKPKKEVRFPKDLFRDD